MADNIYSNIAPDIDQTINTPEYTRVSQGFKSYEGETDTAGKRTGLLLGAAGDLLLGAAKATDYAIEQRAVRETTTQVDNIRDDQIATLRSAEIPTSLQQGIDDLDKLNSAKLQGKIRESQYWAKLDSTARQLRARYPTYRDVIDKTISGMVGTTPANALVRSLQSEAEAQAAAVGGGAKIRFDFYKTYGQYLPPDAIAAEGTEKQWSLTQLLAAANATRRAEVELSLQKSKVELANAYIENNSKTLGLETKRLDIAARKEEDVFNQELNLGFTKAVSNYFPQVQALATEGLNRVGADGTISPKQQQALVEATARVRQEFLNRAREITQKYPQIEAGKLQARIKAFDTILSDMSEATTASALQAGALRLKAVQEEASNIFLSDPHRLAQTTYIKHFGQNAFDTIINASGGRSGLTQDFSNNFRKQLVEKQFGTENMNVTQFYERQRALGASNEEFTAQLKRYSALLTVPVTTEEGFRQLVTNIYGDGVNQSRLIDIGNTSADSKALFYQFTTPSITAEMIRRSAQYGDPTLLNRYEDFLSTSIPRIMTREMSNFETIASRDGKDIDLSFKDNQIVATPKAVSNPETRNRLEIVARTYNNGQLREINNIFKRAIPVWEAQGKDVKTEVGRILNHSWMSRTEKDPTVGSMIARFSGSLLDVDFIGDINRIPFQYTPGSRVSTNVEDVRDSRVGQFASEGLGHALTAAGIENILSTPGAFDSVFSEVSKAGLGEGEEVVQGIIEAMQRVNVQIGERESTNVETARTPDERISLLEKDLTRLDEVLDSSPIAGIPDFVKDRYRNRILSALTEAYRIKLREQQAQ